MKIKILFLMAISFFLFIFGYSQVFAELLVEDSDSDYPAWIGSENLILEYTADTNSQYWDDWYFNEHDSFPYDTNSEDRELFWLNALLENDIIGDGVKNEDISKYDIKINNSFTNNPGYDWDYAIFKFGKYLLAIENDDDPIIDFADIVFVDENTNIPLLLGFDQYGVSMNGISHYTLFNTTPIPEPATMLLFGTGLIGLTGFRRKFKKA